MSRQARSPRFWWPIATVSALGCGVAADVLLDPEVGAVCAAAGGAAAAALVLLLLWVLRLRRQLAAARADAARAHRETAARSAELEHLSTVRLPAVTETVVRQERRLRDSVQAAFEGVASGMHAMATTQQQVLDRVEQLIDDPRLMAEVMRADHAAAQLTRKAQTLLVMCGHWPARRETRPVSLFDCVRGAQSRIVEFGRVEVHGGQTRFAVPTAVEGLMHTIAELLENATVFSPPRAQVLVSVRETLEGAVIEIEDAGPGMAPDVLQQATARLRHELDLAELGAVPRLGLACAGRWARELGFGVELTGTSAFGGMRVVVSVPHGLLAEPVPPGPAAAQAGGAGGGAGGPHGGPDPAGGPGGPSAGRPVTPSS